VTLADDELAVASDARHSGDDSQNAWLELRRGRESAANVRRRAPGLSLDRASAAARA
jgi:hypothetical protein